VFILNYSIFVLLMNVCFCCVRYSFYGTKPRDWLRRTHFRNDPFSVKWIVKSRLGLLVHGQVTIIFVVSVCLFVCLFVSADFFQPSSIRFGSTRTHVTCPGLVVSPRI